MPKIRGINICARCPKFVYTKSSLCRECGRKSQRQRGSTLHGRAATLLASCRHAHKKYGTPFSLTIDHILDLWKAQDGRCALTGLKMEFGNTTEGRYNRNQRIMSVDRIDSSLGYRESNIQLLCVGINNLKSTMTNDETTEMLEEICGLFNERKLAVPDARGGPAKRPRGDEV